MDLNRSYGWEPDAGYPDWGTAAVCAADTHQTVNSHSPHPNDCLQFAIIADGVQSAGAIADYDCPSGSNLCIVSSNIFVIAKLS